MRGGRRRLEGGPERPLLSEAGANAPRSARRRRGAFSDGFRQLRRKGLRRLVHLPDFAHRAIVADMTVADHDAAYAVGAHVAVAVGGLLARRLDHGPVLRHLRRAAWPPPSPQRRRPRKERGQWLSTGVSWMFLAGVFPLLAIITPNRPHGWRDFPSLASVVNFLLAHKRLHRHARFPVWPLSFDAASLATQDEGAKVGERGREPL